MILSTQLKSAVHKTLTVEGFRKIKPSTWLWLGTDVDVGVNLQRGTNSDVHYLNIGFWIHALPSSESRLVHHSHLYFRADALVPDLVGWTPVALTLSTATEHGLLQLQEQMRDILVPWLKECGSLKELQRRFHEGKLSDGLIRKEARAILEAKA